MAKRKVKPPRPCPTCGGYKLTSKGIEGHKPPTLREARRLAKRVWPGAKVECKHNRTHGGAAVVVWVSDGVGELAALTVNVRQLQRASSPSLSRRDALAGLCAALDAMTEDKQPTKRRLR